MTKIVELNINPKILQWAREESGYSVPEMAGKLGLQEELYLPWEKTGTGVPFTILRDIATTLKRQIAVFFLTQIPEKVKKPSDYRNLDIEGAKLSFQTLLAIRRTNKFRDVLLELNGSEYYVSKYGGWLADFDKELAKHPISEKNVTIWLRHILHYSLDDQVNDKNLEDSYLNWRNSFERDLSIHVFQFSMPQSEVQGFTYSDAYPYCIVVNGKYAVSSRIFTLFHELGHILKRQSGLCIPDNVENEQTVELECNLFAGRVLLPDDTMVRTTDKEEIYKHAKQLKVSSEVYLRRLKSLDLVSQDEFVTLLQEIRSSVKRSKGFGISTPLQKSLNSRGQALFNSVLDALNNNKISYGRASDILQVKINHILTA